jgi:hypothetical protein
MYTDLFSHFTGNRSSEVESGEDETTIEPDEGNVLSHLISQLRPGADLSRVTLPTFILEPKSMLERITKYALSSMDSVQWGLKCRHDLSEWMS